MKIITWNCRNNFNDKAAYILDQKPDILIVPECEKTEQLIFKTKFPNTNSVLWFGEDNKKGLGIFSFSDFKLETLEIYNRALKYIVPIKVFNESGSFLLLAVWTHIPYVKQLLKAIEYYDEVLKNNPVIVAGDFNSNTIWDYQSKTFTHSQLVKKLEDKNIFSTYHHFYKENQGKETKMTHHHSATKKQFHIDFCFVSKTLLEQLINVEIGEIDKSDHAPITITFKNQQKENT